MAFFDLPREELEQYAPALDEPADFDEFWATTFADHGSGPLEFECKPVDTHLKVLEAFEVSWNGFDGSRVHGWLVAPRDADQPLPAVVQYTGYSCGRGMPFDNIAYAVGGYAQFIIDARGQGWRTPSSVEGSHDPGLQTSGSVPGLMTMGVLDPELYYYRRLFVDVVRLLEGVMDHDLVDPKRVVVTGGSQGGAMALAAAALAKHRGLEIAGCAPEVPFLCHFSRAIGLTDAYPYKEVADYLATYPQREAQVRETLSYFDGVSMAARISVPGLFSVGLMDEITPPSTVFAAYNHYAGPKAIEVYPFNGHEGGQSYQLERIHRWMSELHGTTK